MNLITTNIFLTNKLFKEVESCIDAKFICRNCEAELVVEYDKRLLYTSNDKCWVICKIECSLCGWRLNLRDSLSFFPIERIVTK